MKCDDTFDAEGSARASANERKRFYGIARSSLAEIDTQLEIALRLNFCPGERVPQLGERMNHLFALISRLIEKTK
ncbi:MAG: four helix bundle protein [bacterium]